MEALERRMEELTGRLDGQQTQLDEVVTQLNGQKSQQDETTATVNDLTERLSAIAINMEKHTIANIAMSLSDGAERPASLWNLSISGQSAGRSGFWDRRLARPARPADTGGRESPPADWAPAGSVAGWLSRSALVTADGMDPAGEGSQASDQLGRKRASITIAMPSCGT
ncbi:hypothetical protein FJT64_024294 [Amphibalanus amphitrite]|uniref:Uncharacterized protein n=1 Tax=Amphibalanus amphitrite TaxID=1232801 RepID=A0A6A4WCQ9_AMPAM|nr:hypothetical protein FJT64_024294 [Amphibalanus amphitrite]